MFGKLDEDERSETPTGEPVRHKRDGARDPPVRAQAP